MRLRHIPGAAEAVAASPFVLDEKEGQEHRGHWRELFGNDAPLHLEIGMGRGMFILAQAAANPDIDFIGLELREEMIMEALERVEAIPVNLRFLWVNAGVLPELFAPGEVDRIYLNFPDPWPKSRHAKRRLTAGSFLQQYADILSADGILRFKTDNADLFHWSRNSFSENGWEELSCTFDQPREEAGIISEYETRYRRKGIPICCGQWRKK